jgi:hypothetical protein
LSIDARIYEKYPSRIELQISELNRIYPRLYHMAEAGSWDSIAANGLLSTEALLDLYGVSGREAERILTQRRPNSMTITAPGRPPAVIRDQGPLSIARLEASLDDMSVSQWLSELNSRVFFWLQESRLLRLLCAGSYRNLEHDVLIIDTATLMREYGEVAHLSRINSGATVWVPPRRGSSTFLPVDDYQHPGRRRALASASDVAELTIPVGVPDIVNSVVRVERRRGELALGVIWEP